MVLCESEIFFAAGKKFAGRVVYTVSYTNLTKKIRLNTRIISVATITYIFPNAKFITINGIRGNET